MYIDIYKKPTQTTKQTRKLKMAIFDAGRKSTKVQNVIQQRKLLLSGQKAKGGNEN